MKVRGSITVFLALTVCLFLAAVFGLLEAARVSALRSNARLSTLQAADSLLAEYRRELWTDYDVLFWEAGSGGGTAALSRAASRQQTFVEGNYSSGLTGLFRDNYYLLGLTLSDVTVDSYELATDRNGAPFRKQAVMAVTGLMTEDALNSLTDMISGASDAGKSEEDLTQIEEKASDALDSLEKAENEREQEIEAARKQREEQKQELEAARKRQEEQKQELEAAGKQQEEQKQAGDTDKTAEELAAEERAQQKADEAEDRITRERRKILRDNPITWMKGVRNKGMLALVMPGEAVSAAEIRTEDLTSHRTLETGNLVSSQASGDGDSIRFHYYLQEKFGYYTEVQEDGQLDYELEYIIAGKESDEENLTAVIRKLLLMREGVNFLYIQRDAQKSSEALAAAAAIATAFAQPELIEPLKQGIMAAWAYAESLNDLRILLDGGKVSLVKTAAQWHTSLNNLSGSITGDAGKNQKKGLKYEQYLQILLGLEKEKKVTYRAMDLIELNENVRMDRMVSQMDCSYRYQAEPIFWEFVTLGNNRLGTMVFPQKKLLSYLEM